VKANKRSQNNTKVTENNTTTLKETYMKKTYVAMMMAGLMGTGMMATTAAAEELPMGITASGDIGIASQYVWRGVAQTGGKTAVQGDLGLALGDFSIGGWFSNAYPATAPQFVGRDVVEFDWTASYGGEIGDTGIGYSVGDILYTYLYDSASNFNEVNAGLSYGPVSLTGYYVTSDSKSKFYLAGDSWVDLGVSGSLYGFDLSGTVSYAKWKTNAAVRPMVGTTNIWKSGVNLVTLGMSKGVTDNLSTSLTATIPVIAKQPDGNRYIYGTAAKKEFVAALNMSY